MAAVMACITSGMPGRLRADERKRWAMRVLHATNAITNPEIVWREESRRSGLPWTWLWFEVASQSKRREAFLALVQDALRELEEPAALKVASPAELTIARPKGGRPRKFDMAEAQESYEQWVAAGKPQLKKWCERRGYDYEHVAGAHASLRAIKSQIAR